MKSPRIVFTSPGKAALQESPPLQPLGPGGVRIETEFSIISPGTELACLSGTEDWAPLPFVPGYGSVGRVVELAPDVKKFSIGDRIFTYGAHAKFADAAAVMLPLATGIDPAKASFARMAAVSITALRVSDAELGDTVAVFGLGLVGNLAAQLFALAGCEVIGIDVSEQRRNIAQQCGVHHVLNPGADLREKVAALTDGRMCHTVVEATGLASVVENSAALAGKLGEVILLGTPRADHATNLTPFLNRIHRWSEGCISFKGAHEWRYPVREDAEGHGRHSMESNVRSILRLVASDELKIEPLLSHRVSPAECQGVYDGLRNQKDTYIGVVYDWSKV